MKDKKLAIVGLLGALVVICLCIFIVIMLNKRDVADEPLPSDYSEVKISVTSPSGAPALGLASAINNPNIALEYDIVDGADVLSSEFLSGEKDLIIAPINLGVKMIENGAEYELLAVLSWGNLYVVGDRSLYNGTIAAFSEAAVPGKVLEYVKDGMQEEVKIDYYASVAEVAALLSQGEYGAALLAEPVLTKLTSTNDNLTILYDIQDLYKEKTGLDRYPQAAIFVKKDAINTKTQAILNLTNTMQTSIANLNNDSSSLSSLDVDFKELGFDDVELLKEAYSRMSLELVYGTDCIDEVKEFLKLFDIEYTDKMYVK